MDNLSENTWGIQSNCIGGDGFDNCISEQHIHQGYQSSRIITKSMINLGLLIILIAGLILGTYLTYRRHKGEKGLGKRILKWNFIYILIIFTLWLGFGFLFRYILGPFANPQTISIGKP